MFCNFVKILLNSAIWIFKLLPLDLHKCTTGFVKDYVIQRSNFAHKPATVVSINNSCNMSFERYKYQADRAFWSINFHSSSISSSNLHLTSLQVTKDAPRLLNAIIDLRHANTWIAIESGDIITLLMKCLKP